MSQAIAIETFGGPEVLKLITVESTNPGPNEVQIKHTAIEVNYIDIYHRAGTRLLDTHPKIPGMSAVGVVSKVGSSVKDFAVGDRVGYATSPLAGSYCEMRNIDSQLLIPLPPKLDDKILASCLLKGITAHMLACQVYVVRPATAVLIHAAAGGVGRQLAGWCNFLGAYVIGAVGSEEKKKIAMASGCHLAINYNAENLVSKVREATGNMGVNVVYDSIGDATFNQSLDCLMNIGMMVLYGATSGEVAAINTDLIANKSLFFTRPSLFHYKSTKKELISAANAFFALLADGILKAPAPIEFKLSDAAEAHKLVESRQNLSPVILIP